MGFQQALELFEAARQTTTALISDLSQEQMDFAPVTGKWSIGENVDHLLLSEKVYRDQFAQLIAMAREGKKPVLRVTARDVNFAPFFLPKSLLPLVEMPFAMVTQFVPSTVKEFMIRYPFLPGQNPDVARPAKGRAAATLRRELDESIRQTTALLMANAELDYRNMIARHPMIGVNNVVELLRILALHEQRHHGQISSVRNSLRFPKADRQVA
jgi:uncharacterized damage-inducible protein DinB